MATILTATYGTATAITLDLSSLATSSDFTVGVESNEVDNTTNLFVDAMVYPLPFLGHASTAPAPGQEGRLYCWGYKTSIAGALLDVLAGSSAGRTLSSVSVLGGLARAGTARISVATAAKKQLIRPFSIASLFDGIMPNFWGLYFAHNHTGSLAAAQTGLFSYVGQKYTNT